MCINMAGLGECDCFDTTTFTTQFEEDIRSSFLSTQAFAAPIDPMYCNIANQRICQFSEMNHSCCCNAETELYRKCLVETVFPQELPPPVAYETSTCQHVCPTMGSENQSKATMVGSIAGVLVLVFGSVLICYNRRRNTCCNKKLPDEGLQKKTRMGGFWSRHCDVEHPPKETPNEVVVDLESGDQNSTLIDEERSDTSLKADVPVYVTKNTPSKAFLEEVGESLPKQMPCEIVLESEERNSKAEILRKKRAIEDWNKDRKDGSARSLQSYLSTDISDTEPLVDDEKNHISEETREERRLRREKKKMLRKSNSERPKRHSSRRLLDVDADADDTNKKSDHNEIGQKTSLESNAERSSSRDKMVIEAVDNEKKGHDKVGRKKSLASSKGRSSSRLDIDDTGKKPKERESRGKDQEPGHERRRRSSSRHLSQESEVASDDKKRADQDRKADKQLKTEQPVRSSSRRLLETQGDSGSEKIPGQLERQKKQPRKSSSRRRLEMEGDNAENKALQDDQPRRVSSRSKLVDR